MLPNTQLLNHQITAKSHVFKPKVTSALMLLSLLGLGAVILASQAHAAENVAIKPNLYAEKYVEQNGSHLKSLNSNPDTKLELSKNQEEDNTRMLENGYDMMGSSAFVETNIPAELALQQGKEIKADMVLVYNKNVSLSTKIVRLDGDQEGVKAADEANKLAEQAPQTIHFASYWAKLPTPLFGVHLSLIHI